MLYRLQLKGWYPDGGDKRKRGEREKEDVWNREGRRRESEREAENGHRVGRLQKERIAAPCRFSDEEIVADGLRKYGYLFLVMLCQRPTPLLCIMILGSWAIPSAGHEPGTNKERWGLVEGVGGVRCLGVSQCHKLLDKATEVKWMKWRAKKRNPTCECMKFAPNKQTCRVFFWG